MARAAHTRPSCHANGEKKRGKKKNSVLYFRGFALHALCFVFCILRFSFCVWVFTLGVRGLRFAVWLCGFEAYARHSRFARLRFVVCKFRSSPFTFRFSLLGFSLFTFRFAFSLFRSALRTLRGYLASGDLPPFYQGLHRLANLRLEGGQQRRRVDRLRRSLRLGDHIAQRLHATKEKRRKKERESKKNILHTGTSTKTQTYILQQHRQSACHYVGTPVWPSACLFTRLSVCLSVGMIFCRSPSLSLQLPAYVPVGAYTLCLCSCRLSLYVSLSVCLYSCNNLSLSVCLPVCLSACFPLSVYPRACLLDYLPVYPSVSVCVFLSLSPCLPIHLSTILSRSVLYACLSASLHICLLACLSLCLPACLSASLPTRQSVLPSSLSISACLPVGMFARLPTCFSIRRSTFCFLSVWLSSRLPACQALTCLA